MVPLNHSEKNPYIETHIFKLFKRVMTIHTTGSCPTTQGRPTDCTGKVIDKPYDRDVCGSYRSLN